MLKDKRIARDRNARVTDVARNTIANLSGRWQDHNANSVKAGGVDCLIYTVKQNGLRCTCGEHTKQMMDANGNLPPEVMHTLLSGAEVSIDDYASNRVAPNDLNVLMADEDEPVDDQDVDIDFPEPENGDSVDTDAVDRMNDHLLGEQTIGYGQVRCSICFGAKYVGGYDLVNGIRLVLENRDIIGGMSYTVDGTKQPYEVELLEPGAYVNLTLTIPRNTSRIDALNLWRNDNFIATGYVLRVGPTIVTHENFHTFATGLPLVLTIEAEIPMRFTHLELQFGWDFARVDFSVPSRANNNLRLYDNSTVELTLPLMPIHAKAWLGSIIAVDNEFWRVTNIAPNEDHAANVRWTQATARKVEPYEVDSILPRRSVVRLMKKVTVGRKYDAQKFW